MLKRLRHSWRVSIPSVLLRQDFAQLPKQISSPATATSGRGAPREILSPRYDEAPDLYFDWSSARPTASASPRFALSIEQLRRIEQLLKEHELASCFSFDRVHQGGH